MKTNDTSTSNTPTARRSAESNRTDALHSVTSAKGDGKADDTGAIQADIAAMEAAGGGTLLLKSGTYKLTSTIRIRQSNIGIKGAGRSTVFLAVSDYGHVFDCRLDTDPKTWHGFRLTDETYTLPPVRISRKEAFSFGLARKLLDHYEGTPLHLDMRSVLDSRPKGDGLPAGQQRSEAEWQHRRVAGGRHHDRAGLAQ